MRFHILGFMALCLAIYAGFYYAFYKADTIFGMVPSSEFCNGTTASASSREEPCRRPDLFAFQMASVVAMYTAALIGIYEWYINKRGPHAMLPPTPEGRLFGYLAQSERLSAYSFAYQAFDFVVSLTIPEHCTPIMMAHHFLAAAVAYCSIRYQFLHYYGFFYLGLSEVSTLFLVWMDLANYYTPVPGSVLATFIEAVAGPAFVVTFTWYRVLQWWPVSIQLFRDAHHVMQSGKLEQLRPKQSWVLWVFLCSNLPLGLLQLYWLTIILGEVQKTLFA